LLRFSDPSGWRCTGRSRSELLTCVAPGKELLIAISPTVARKCIKSKRSSEFTWTFIMCGDVDSNCVLQGGSFFMSAFTTNMKLVR
jgi:hypothetical protein